MSAGDVVYCMLSALFSAAAIHGLRRGVLSRDTGWRGRGDNLLHAAMASAMAAMPWGWVTWLHQPGAVAFFAPAALWFPLTADRRQQESRLAATSRRLPYAAGMAAMAWTARASHPAAGPSHENVASLPMAAHHATLAGHAVHPSNLAQAATAVLALYLLACALRSLIRVMPALSRAPNTAERAGPYEHFWDGSTTLGTAIMLLMPH
ncbi:DUF5134 domain-containing protein [Streptomyces sp. NPDC005917]|uniref:DUF5134 domain-containing protein n=1 Tax=unclassified Streptomyces TaxID=2593676 RepID=UPI0033DD9E45